MKSLTAVVRFKEKDRVAKQFSKARNCEFVFDSHLGDKPVCTSDGGNNADMDCAEDSVDNTKKKRQSGAGVSPKRGGATKTGGVGNRRDEEFDAAGDGCADVQGVDCAHLRGQIHDDFTDSRPAGRGEVVEGDTILANGKSSAGIDLGLAAELSPSTNGGLTAQIEIVRVNDSSGMVKKDNTKADLDLGLDPSRNYDVEPMGARIKVIGVGGGGGNAVNNMIRSGLKGVEFIAANTDAQALKSSEAEVKLALGHTLTKGLGAGANPDVGEAAAAESEEDIRQMLQGADMVFVTAGMGGGTGGGGASIIAKVAREVGALTVGVVTKPFVFEGKRRMSNAESGIAKLEHEVDTLITIPNQRLLSVAGRNTTLLDTFRKADEVLFQAVKGISDLILFEGLVNVDFADVKAVMSEMGMAMMGSGQSSGENRAIEAAERAISSPLLEDVSIHGARGVLINVTAGPDVTLQEINEAAELIHSESHDEANIIWGMVIDPEMGESVRVTVIATGFGDRRSRQVSSHGVSRSGGVRSAERDLEAPAYARRGQEQMSDTVKLKKISVISSAEDEEKYEIPTFLRRQAE